MSLQKIATKPPVGHPKIWSNELGNPLKIPLIRVKELQKNVFLSCDFGPKGTSCSIPFQLPSNGILNPFSGLHGKHVHRQKPYNFSKGTCNTLAVQQKSGGSKPSFTWVKGRKGEPSGRKHTLRAHTTHNSVNTWGKTKGAVEEKPFPTFMMGIPSIFWDSRGPRSSDFIVLVAFCLKINSRVVLGKNVRT